MEQGSGGCSFSEVKAQAENFDVDYYKWITLIKSCIGISKMSSSAI